MSQTFTDDCYASGHQATTDLQAYEDNFAALKSAFSGATAPSNIVAGMSWLDTTLSLLKTRNAADDAWNIVLNVVASGLVAGDIFYCSATNVVSALAKGAAYQVLTMNSGATAPAWAASLQSLLTAKGDIVYASAANTPARLAKGTAGQVLTMGSSGAPEWSAGGASYYQSSLTEVSEAVTSTYTKKKDIDCVVAGIYDVSFDAYGGIFDNARIYVDGVATGTERTLTSSYVTYREKITVTAGQNIQVYVKRAAGGTIYVRNFIVQLCDSNMTIVA